MERTTDNGESWRNWITPFLKSKGIVVLDPCNKPKTTLGNCADESQEAWEKLKKLKSQGNFDELSSSMRAIRNVDLRLTDKSDFFIVYWDKRLHPVGTVNEIAIAVQQKKPVLMMCEEGVKDLQNWFFGAIPKELFFDSWLELKKYLVHVDEDENVDHLGRWQLFDYEFIGGLVGVEQLEDFSVRPAIGYGVKPK